jgi:hypothetical protein
VGGAYLRIHTITEGEGAWKAPLLYNWGEGGAWKAPLPWVTTDVFGCHLELIVGGRGLNPFLRFFDVFYGREIDANLSYLEVAKSLLQNNM